MKTKRLVTVTYSMIPGTDLVSSINMCCLTVIYTVSQKKGATLIIAITVSILDGFAKFFD